MHVRHIVEILVHRSNRIFTIISALDIGFVMYTPLSNISFYKHLLDTHLVPATVSDY